ncbi:MAG TPA: ADP-ribosylglycohydrolase family protein [Candidatus Methylacidiphilales bacterium]
MATIRDYEKQVYAAVLGKTIGVYLGRPFEGWSKEAIEKTWGKIDRYVHEDRNVPLVVSDDDLSGTFTFVRALEDSGLYAETPPAFFGKAWLDYIVEGKSILWWGGLGCSTEHTAYLRLKKGVPSPASGSIAANGLAVAEQIGAQIFIDAFGMVAPGDPALAAKLARRSASVSHDGEAVHAAALVAAMVSAAFVEKKMEKILAAGIAQIPGDSLIARLHAEIAAWCRRDRDWRKTFARIEEKYGYRRFGGGCHVVPNHALMALAWNYAPDDFHRAMEIVCTAGWDTDCNAANVGAVMALVVGLDRICEAYDFHSPFADRLILPTADGTRGTSDCLIEALHIARIGRKIAGLRPVPPPKKGAWHHFEMPGALHGYLPAAQGLAVSGIDRVENVKGHSKRGGRSLRIPFRVSAGKVGRVSTPTLGRHEKDFHSSYHIMGTPRIYPGQKVVVSGESGTVTGRGPARLRLFVGILPESGGKENLLFGKPLALRPKRGFSLSFTLPPSTGCIGSFGIQVEGDGACEGEVFVDTVAVEGRPNFTFHPMKPGIPAPDLTGTIHDTDLVRHSLPEDTVRRCYVGKDEGQGILAVGNTDWTDYVAEASVKIHLADRGGIMGRYQGLTRHLSLQLVPGNKAQLLLRHYDQTLVLDEKAFRWEYDKAYHLSLDMKGSTLVGTIDGKPLLKAKDPLLLRGGAGLVWTTGMIGFEALTIR